MGKYRIATSEDYQITLTQLGDEWLYQAYGPLNEVKEVNGVTMFEELEYKVHYGIGEEVPPAYDYRTRKTHRTIGGFHSKRCGTAADALAQAKAACEQHRSRLAALQNARVLPSINDNGAADPRALTSDSSVCLPNSEQAKQVNNP